MNGTDSGIMIQILLVEDDPGDVLITREAFADNKVRNHLSVVSDGEAAMAFLRREGEFASAPRPDLILLDLNLPRKAGHEVLAEVKSDADLQRIPVVILTAKDLTVEDRQQLKGNVEQILQKGDYNRDQLLSEVRELVRQSIHPQPTPRP